MDLQLCVDDAVLVSVANNDGVNQDADSSEDVQIGLIKYIGYIHGYEMQQYVGIELVESINTGHNGTINGFKYFDCAQGHGIHTNITNIIQKLNISQVTMKMQQIITMFKSRLDQYVEALSERDEYIERLKSKQRELRRIIKENDESPSNKSNDDISSPYSISTKHASPSNPNRCRKTPKMSKSRSYTPPNELALKTDCIPSKQPQQQSTYSHIGHQQQQQDEIQNKRVNTKQLKVIIPSFPNQAVLRQTVSNSAAADHHRYHNQFVSVISGNNIGPKMVINPRITPSNSFIHGNGGLMPNPSMINYQPPQQQNLINMNNPRQSQQQQVVILYPMPNNNQYDGVMNVNQSYCHFMQQRQQQQ